MATTDNSREVHSLIADIGGTNARLQLISFKLNADKPDVVKQEFYQTKDFKTFNECLTEFVKGLKEKNMYPQNATLGVAAAPFNNKLKMVNCHWPEMDGNAIGKEFNIEPFVLINDFEAIGYSLLKLPQEYLVPLTKVDKVVGRSMAVVGSGTGLGECVLNAAKAENGEQKYYVCPTEGGHKDFAPTDKIDIDYLQFCLEEVPEVKKFKYLSVERSFCGPAIPTMYQFFNKRENAQPKEIDSKKIFQEGLNKTDPICVKVLEFYARLLGKEVSNFACDSLPYAGIYLVGGMINSVKKYFTEDPECPFIKAYFSKDEVTNTVLSRFPIYIVSYEELGLLGAFVKAQLDAKGIKDITSEVAKNI